MADKTAELLMGAENPNRPDMNLVRFEVIKHLRHHRDEIEDENAELRCASRELNQRLMKQALCIEAEKQRRQELEALMGQARAALITSHSKRYPSHLTFKDRAQGYRVGCATCDVLQAMERSAR